MCVTCFHNASESEGNDNTRHHVFLELEASIVDGLYRSDITYANRYGSFHPLRLLFEIAEVSDRTFAESLNVRAVVHQYTI